MTKKNMFQEYQRNEEIEREKQELANKYNIEQENVSVSKKKVSKITLLYSFIKNLSSKAVKIVFYILIFLLVTVGATVLMNETLRNQIISIFIQNI